MVRSLLILAAFLLALDIPKVLTRSVSVSLGVLHDLRVKQMLDGLLRRQAMGVLVGDLR